MSVASGRSNSETRLAQLDPLVVYEPALLTGERGPEYLRTGVRTLDTRTPESRLVTLDGIGHLGIQSAPARVADAVRAFCR